MADLRLFLFGEPQLRYQGETLSIDRRKAFALLASLALTKHRQQRDVLATLLWPDRDQEHALAALRTTLFSLTNLLLTVDWLDKERMTLSLNHDVIWIDVVEFQSLLNQVRVHRHDSKNVCADCAGLLRAAVELYQADFMAGFAVAQSSEYDDWQIMQRELLRRDFAFALRRLAEFYGDVEDYEAALHYAHRWLNLDSLHEPAHRMLMRLYAASGQRTEAMRQYLQCVELLDTELATPPEEETQQLYAAIQAESPTSFASFSAAVGQKPSVLPALPSLVVGREQALRDLKSRLGIDGELRSTTVIQGWPGVGKSTIVAALAHDEDIARSFPDGILWASLGESPNLLSELSVWASALGLSQAGNEQKPEAIKAQLVTALRDRRMLLIVDDVWQIDHAALFKVGGQACATVLTSRLNDVAQGLAPTAYDVYRLSVLSEGPALELLSRLTPETVAEHPEEARELVRDLEGLPLAIQVAGRLLHSEARLGWGVSNLLEELRSGAALLEAQIPGDVVNPSQETSATITALLKRSTDALSPELQLQFALLGIFVPKPATFDLGAMAAAWETSDPRPVARILVNRGLMEPISGGRFQMHALLVLHARTLLEEMMHE